MARIYTDKASITIDLGLYLAVLNDLPLHLGHFPKLASDRWPWIVENWYTTLYSRFITQASGDDYLLNSLRVLDNYVISWRNGVRINPLQNMIIFTDSVEFLETILINDLRLTIAEEQFLEEQIKQTREMQLADFQSMNRFLREQRDLAFDVIGLEDITYNAYRNRSSATKQRDFFVTDLYQVDDAIKLESIIDGIIYDFKRRRNLDPNLLNFANTELARFESDIRVQDTFQSYVMVPFERSLEQMARDYLGDSDLWYELVTINKLKPPYVDLFGQKVEILENASGNALRVPITLKAKFPVGATIKVGSRVVPEQIRKVEVFIDNADGSATLYLSGEQDLSKLRTIHLAYIRVYEPETAHDFSFIKVPTSITSPYKNVPEPTRADLRQIDLALYSFGVDLLRDDSTGDLVISSGGDLAISFGIPAVRQAIKSAVTTEFGELPFHANYGLPSTVGFALDPEETGVRVSNLIQQTLSRDKRFTKILVDSINISPEGVISLSLKVQVAGKNDLIPLAFVV